MVLRTLAHWLPRSVRKAVRRAVGPSRQALLEQLAVHRGTEASLTAELVQLAARCEQSEAELGAERRRHREAKSQWDAESARLKAELREATEQHRAAIEGRDDLAARCLELERALASVPGGHRSRGGADELYLSARTGLSLPPEHRATTAELVASLNAHGVPVAADESVLVHVGFGHAATTSLQLGFFSGRPDLFYLGMPYAQAGGVFSYIKYLEDLVLDPAEIYRLLVDHVYADPARAGRPIVVSDETFVETSEVYYAARLVPLDQVAARLRRFLPTARILFTIRSQFDYVRSMYFNLKRNFGYLAGMPLPPFEEWWEGMQTQLRCLYLQNIDYSRAVRAYADLFGRENVLVLPLEEIEARGAEQYLGRLCRFIGVPLTPADLERFRTPRNSRMSVVEVRVAELLAARHGGAMLHDILENPSLVNLMTSAPKATVALSDEIAEQIRNRAAPGNRWLAETFGVPLADYGYPV